MGLSVVLLQHHCSCSPLLPTESQHYLYSYTAEKLTVREVMMLYCILEELRLSMANCAKIEKRLFLCCRVCVCVWIHACLCEVLLDQLSCREKVRPRQGAFCLSAAAVSSFIELEFIIQPFFCVMSSRAGGRWRGRERERNREGA